MDAYLSRETTRSIEEGSAMSIQLLPDDVFADVLGRVAPRDLAVSRCVCEEWRAIINGRRLLRSDLLPLSLAGIFIHYNELLFPGLFRRPSSSISMDLRRHCMSMSYRRQRHCNGVVLLYNGLLNSATGWRAPLPELPPPRMGMENRCFINDTHVVFDPAVSSHCEVFLVPRVLQIRDLKPSAYKPSDSREILLLESEWPPSRFVIDVFSTVAGRRRWTETTLIRDSEPIGPVGEMQFDERYMLRRPSVYWRGALYIRCELDFIMRISLSDNTYRVIEPPCGTEIWDSEYMGDVHLQRSEKGVYFAFVDDESRLRVWVLDESCSPMKWVLKHNTGIRFPQQVNPNYICPQVHVDGPWILENTNPQKGDIIETPAEQGSKWNSDSDEDIDVNIEDRDDGNLSYQHFDILGFHPYKEIVFLSQSVHAGFAYH